MADVTCPLCSEDLDALLADEQLPSELAGVFEEPDRMVDLSDGYEVQLTEAEARALLTWAKSHEIHHLESDLRVGSPRRCPVCQAVDLTGRQTACSASCRRERSRQRETATRQARDREIRALRETALRKMQEGP